MFQKVVSFDVIVKNAKSTYMQKSLNLFVSQFWISFKPFEKREIPHLKTLAKIRINSSLQ